MSPDILWRVTFWKNDMKKEKNKKEKSKIVYVDDGSRIADMSQLRGPGFKASGRRSTFREQLATYLSTVKLMIMPMFITIGIITAAFLLLYILLSIA